VHHVGPIHILDAIRLVFDQCSKRDVCLFSACNGSFTLFAVRNTLEGSVWPHKAGALRMKDPVMRVIQMHANMRAFVVKARSGRPVARRHGGKED